MHFLPFLDGSLLRIATTGLVSAVGYHLLDAPPLASTSPQLIIVNSYGHNPFEL